MNPESYLLSPAEGESLFSSGRKLLEDNYGALVLVLPQGVSE